MVKKFANSFFSCRNQWKSLPLWLSADCSVTSLLFLVLAKRRPTWWLYFCQSLILLKRRFMHPIFSRIRDMAYIYELLQEQLCIGRLVLNWCMLVLDSLYVSCRAPKVFLYRVLAYTIIFMSYLFSTFCIVYCTNEKFVEGKGIFLGGKGWSFRPSSWLLLIRWRYFCWLFKKDWNSM